MGVDGRLLIGDGILINPKHLPDEWFQFLKTLGSKYYNLFELNLMEGVDRDHWMVVWKEKPRNIFPGKVRRPLIINSADQLELMIPSTCVTCGGETFGEMNMDDVKIWNPSYEDFMVQLDDYFGKEKEIREGTIDNVKNSAYEDENDGLNKLTEDEVKNLSTLLMDPQYTLVGNFMAYIAD